MTQTNNTVLITGCSSGFGRLAATTFHDRGWNVVATMRSPEKETELNQLENVLVTRLDVSDAASINDAVQKGTDRFGQIDALVNNAGFGGHALFEQMGDEAIMSMYETNVFGLMRVCRAVLPQMRARGEGAVVNVTSVAGLAGFPTFSVYCSSKHAVEGLTEALSFEFAPLGISFKTVAPGAYPTTRFNANTDDHLESGDDQLKVHAEKLHGHIRAVAEQMAQHGGSTADPQEVADRIYQCVTEDTPVHNPVGSDAAMLYEMMGGPARQQFLDNLAPMVMPNEGVTS